MALCSYLRYILLNSIIKRIFCAYFIFNTFLTSNVFGMFMNDSPCWAGVKCEVRGASLRGGKM